MRCGEVASVASFVPFEPRVRETGPPVSHIGRQRCALLFPHSIFEVKGPRLPITESGCTSRHGCTSGQLSCHPAGATSTRVVLSTKNKYFLIYGRDGRSLSGEATMALAVSPRLRHFNLRTTTTPNHKRLQCARYVPLIFFLML